VQPQCRHSCKAHGVLDPYACSNCTDRAWGPHYFTERNGPDNLTISRNGKARTAYLFRTMRS